MLLQQLIDLLTQPPGNLVYHLVTLFALQAVFAFGYTQWQRNPEDDQARRTAWAAAGIFVGRLILLIAGLSAETPTSAAIFLPPLEQAIHTATAILLIWALIPPPAKNPRLSDILAVGGLILSAVMLLFFLQEWRTLVQTSGTTSYATTTQATLWGAAQLAILTAGLILSLLRPATRNSLRPAILVLLVAAAIAQLWIQPLNAISSTNAPFWMRLGQLAAFPLWVVVVYLESLRPLLATSARYDTQTDQFATTLTQIASLLTLPTDQRPAASALIAHTLINDLEFAALAMPEENGQLTFTLGRQTIVLPSAEWPRLQRAFSQQEAQRFLPNGVGARDWHQFYASAEIPPAGPLLAQPLIHPTTQQPVGLLMLGAKAAIADWPDNAITLAAALAPLLAIALASAEIHHPDHANLSAERDALRAELIATRALQQQTEQKLARTRSETRALASSLAALEARLRKENP